MVRYLMVCLLIGTQMSAMEPSKAMANSAQVQAARAKAEARAQEEADVQKAVQASLAQEQPTAKTEPKKSLLRNKWLYIAGASVIGVVSYWYFRDTVNSTAQARYTQVISLVRK